MVHPVDKKSLSERDICTQFITPAIERGGWDLATQVREEVIVVDECHRGSAADDSAWRSVLDYFSSATQIGLTATPKETADISTTHYFGEPVYTNSLKQGIEDGFLAPYNVVRFDLDKDVEGWRPSKGKLDKHGNEIEDRIYNQRDFDRTLVLEQRTTLVARKVSQYLAATDRMAKTIVFCDDMDLAQVNISQAKLAATPIPLPHPRRAAPHRRQGRRAHEALRRPRSEARREGEGGGAARGGGGAGADGLSFVV